MPLLIHKAAVAVLVEVAPTGKVQRAAPWERRPVTMMPEQQGQWQIPQEEKCSKWGLSLNRSPEKTAAMLLLVS